MSEKREVWIVREDLWGDQFFVVGERDTGMSFMEHAACQNRKDAAQIVHEHNTYGDLLAAATAVVNEWEGPGGLRAFNTVLHKLRDVLTAVSEGSQSTTQDGSQ